MYGVYNMRVTPERVAVDLFFAREGAMADKEGLTSFSSKDRDDGSGKTDHLFNRESDGDKHGHVVTSDDGQTTHYARDEDGNVYVDDSKK